MKELLLVCIGSFFGGGARYLVGKAVQSWVAVSSFPVLDRLPVAFPKTAVRQPYAHFQHAVYVPITQIASAEKAYSLGGKFLCTVGGKERE